MKEKRDNKIPHQSSGIDKSNEYSVFIGDFSHDP